MYLAIVESLVIVDKTWETDFLLNKFSCNSGFSCFPPIFNSGRFFERHIGNLGINLFKYKLILSIHSELDSQIIQSKTIIQRTNYITFRYSLSKSVKTSKLMFDRIQKFGGTSKTVSFNSLTNWKKVAIIKKTKIYFM